MFKIRMGIPEMQDFWDDLTKKVKNGKANKNEMAQYNKLGRAFYHLSLDPFYLGLNTHEIPEMSKRYRKKVWQSYLENNKSAAGRFYWSYGPRLYSSFTGDYIQEKGHERDNIGRDK